MPLIGKVNQPDPSRDKHFWARLYVEKVLAPTLRPGDMVVVDNLASHRRPDIGAAIRQCGAKLFFLPKYSPDLNPIEQVFAKLKHLLRNAAARSQTAVTQAIGALLDTYSAEECTSYFRNAGYAPTQRHHALGRASFFRPRSSR